MSQYSKHPVLSPSPSTWRPASARLNTNTSRCCEESTRNRESGNSTLEPPAPCGGRAEGALLVVEISESSLPQDRLTKSRIYAAAGIPEYWIVNLRDRRLEVFTKPDVARRVYLEKRDAGPDETVVLAALPDTTVAVASLLQAY